MFVLVLTGGAGAGKSEAGRFFSQRGAVVVDLDDVAKDMIEPKGPAYEAVVAEFGRGILDRDGRVRTAALAAAAFADAEATRRLNAAVHPHVTAEVRRLLGALAALPEPPAVVVLEVPLVTEVPEIAESADHVLTLEADPRVRVARLTARGMEESDALRRLARQGTEEERVALADSVIRNDGGSDELHGQLAAFWAREVVPHVA
ncbi:MAG: dephospho-CoA kinase [Coriobacteriia bacterium]|nr:dephospho-CoA kinase [Coriobacteriia bacterium]